MTRMRFLFTLVFTTLLFVNAHASNSKPRNDAAAEWLQAQTSPPQIKPQQKEPVKPPSTGKELSAPKVQQKMSAEQAGKIIDEALAMAKKPGFDGDQIIGMLTTALPVASPKVTPQSEPAYDVLARLSLKEKYWQTLLQSSAMILKSNPNYRRPALFPRALVGLGDYKLATEVINDFKKKYPKDAELVATEAVMYRQQQKWPETLKLAGEALKMAEVDEPSQKNFNLEIGHYLKADALTHLGKLSEASKEYDAIEKINPKAPYLTRYRKRSASIGISKLIVERVIQNPVPLGTYHLYSEKGGIGSLVQLKLYNIEPKDRQLRVEVELPGLTEKATKTITMLKNTREDVRLVPPLKLGFDLAAMRAERTVQMTIKIIEMDAKGERTIYDDSKSLTILPRDFLPLFRQVSEEGDIRRTPEYIGAWVTSNATAVDKFLGGAKLLHPKKQFVGEQDETMSQVSAIFAALKARGVSYVMDPAVVSDRVKMQRTRLPADVLASTNAQCLEGTILFATMMESIGLRPVIVLVPGHAFVGWHQSKFDKPLNFPSGLPAGYPAGMVFIETTMVGTYTFEQAVNVAVNRVIDESKEGHFKNGLSQFVELTALRSAGIKAQPMN